MDRSEVMRRVQGENTTPERKVRSLLHRLGYRFRLHRKDLPGSPDIVLPKYRTAIFVHGCFWHRHDCKRGQRFPSTNTGYWSRKFTRNVDRDREKTAQLEGAGWQVMVVWECELRDVEALVGKLERIRGGG